MHQSIRFLFISVITLTGWINLFGQASSKDLDRWADELSVRTDIHNGHYTAVVSAIKKLDSTTWCTILNQLEEKAKKENTRFKIRLQILKRSLHNLQHPCYELKTLITYLKEALQKAYEIEDRNLIEMCNRSLASLYRVSQEYGLAIMHQRIVVEMQEELQLENFTSVASDRYVLGELYYWARQYQNAIRFSLQALKYEQSPDSPRGDTLGPFNRMFLYNTLGLAYEKTMKYDSAYWAFSKAMEMARMINHTHWIGLLEGNRGDILFEQGNYDSARVLLELDVKNSLSGGQNWADNAANSMQKLARIQIHQNKPRLAIDQLRKAETVLKQLPQPGVQAQIYYAYMLAYQKIGQPDSLFAYTQKYITLHDSIESKAADERAEIIEVRYNNQENIHKIQSLNKDKKRIALIRNFIIALTVLSAAFGFLYINRQKLKMRIRHQKMEDEKKLAEAEAIAAKEQLDIFTGHILEKNNLVEKLQEELSQKEVDQDQFKTIEELSHHSILTDDDWDRFRHLFEKVHPGFFLQLKMKAPDISLAEQRIAAFSKLRFSTKEAANLLGISPASVNKTRQRLRQRLSIDPDTDLELYFAS